MVTACDRIDIIRFLEGTVSEYWEGDEHSFGVFVDTHYGYYLNRVYGVRVEHCNHVSPLFYTFQDVGIDSKIVDTYPYKEQKKSPKKRELLYQGDSLKESELVDLFEGGEKWFEASNDVISEQADHIVSTIPNKRERQRLTCEILLKESEVTTCLVRERKNARLIISEKMSKVSNAQSVTENPSIRVNANSYYYALNAAKRLTDVTFYVERSKKLLVRGTLRKNDDTESEVVVVIALNKGRI